MSVFAVVPILPTLTSLFLMLPALLLSVLAAVASLRHPAVLRKVLRLVWRQKFALLLVGVGLAGAGWAGSVWSRWLAQPGLSAGPSGPDWPMDRGSLARCGWVPGDASPAAGRMCGQVAAPASRFSPPRRSWVTRCSVSGRGGHGTGLLLGSAHRTAAVDRRPSRVSRHASRHR